jgi:hypothetical protein
MLGVSEPVEDAGKLVSLELGQRPLRVPFL